ncbi:MAG: transposase [Desulfuromonadales bacterium]|nr:transposase [Desulfuromonadales bacterium]
MPRVARGLADNHVYHILNRGNGRQAVFFSDEDFATFIELVGTAGKRFAVESLAYCLLPNHFHLLVRPARGAELGRFMQWLMTSHVRRHHRVYQGSGHLWQGRYKSFPVKDDAHLLTVMRYIEGNPVRAGLVASAREWPWSSHLERVGARPKRLIADAPIPLPPDWGAFVDQPLTEGELERLGQSVTRQAPYGDGDWQMDVCEKYGLESTVRKRGRPRRG